MVFRNVFCVFSFDKYLLENKRERNVCVCLVFFSILLCLSSSHLLRCVTRFFACRFFFFSFICSFIFIQLFHSLLLLSYCVNSIERCEIWYLVCNRGVYQFWWLEFWFFLAWHILSLCLVNGLSSLTSIYVSVTLCSCPAIHSIEWNIDCVSTSIRMMKIRR